GGHAHGDQANDVLMQPDRRAVRVEAPRVHRGMRGTGCVLSSAIAASLAQGLPLEAAVRGAKTYVLELLRGAR
ncbi:MAG: hydroxymethylpyrimidine/phosphomethylpyrimidine kinase, partial [Mesorhizobium sp.]